MNPFLSFELLRQEGEQEKIMRFMRAADVGIDRLELKEEEFALPPPNTPATPGWLRIKVEIEGQPGQSGQQLAPAKGFRVFAWHKQTDTKREIPLDMGDESDGTRKLLLVAGYTHSPLEQRYLLMNLIEACIHT